MDRVDGGDDSGGRDKGYEALTSTSLVGQISK